MKNMRYFNYERPLLKNAIIYRDFKRILSSAKAEYALSNKALTIFSRLISGEVIEWESTDMIESSTSLNNVGCVKTPEYTLNDVILKNEIISLKNIHQSDIEVTVFYQKSR